ncbi:hypothetical protein SAV14893_045250 [Streptomyces avermitilis]|uniref:Uncharacterized protein n=1 Tax=Streptomyces avermitilis TaxID=33903 RepID=A0A4D4LUX2_STRAX|nr:hypothetical protein SAVMC3_57440 [Streptomyces avermitilis]GDY65132.1 hypothetical protein SAV14893_045250 [Streptomyces avermitilis]GDY74662.1 hypothetical protein SAV31267_041470 [Streptomyces avermitilis]GDY83705.1 hypothetical protein SAVCW2_29040 [Streptomyces avermitilis]
MAPGGLDVPRDGPPHRLAGACRPDRTKDTGPAEAQSAGPVSVAFCPTGVPGERRPPNRPSVAGLDEALAGRIGFTRARRGTRAVSVSADR